MLQDTKYYWINTRKQYQYPGMNHSNSCLFKWCTHKSSRYDFVNIKNPIFNSNLTAIDTYIQTATYPGKNTATGLLVIQEAYP